MQDWLNGYEHDPEPGAGLAVGPGADKIVLHTTESPRGSLNAIRNLWRGSANWGRGLPHFLIDGTRVVQLLPLSVNAYTAKNAPGGADINRAGHVIQTEICGYAADDFDAETYEAVGKWIADLRLAGLGVDINNVKPFVGAEAGMIATERSKYRMGADVYTNFNGICGHQHLPENDHWDPGHKDGARLVAIANSHLSATAPVNPTNQEDEEVVVIAWDAQGAYACSGILRRPLTGDQVNAYKYLGTKDIGRNESFLSLFTIIPNDRMA